REASHDDVNMIFGSVIDPDLEDEVVVTVIATGFEDKPRSAMRSYDKWRPKREIVSLKGSEKVLAKSIGPGQDEDELDVPTFMRKPVAGEENSEVIQRIKG
ncbi:MAG TPA: hypothetical protein ENG93_00495, partial [Nitrospirae bacterium]|nr:hypothetical protein [Nitrospirota bacterium]